MLTIRLRRQGAKRDPHYRVVVTEQSTRRDGAFLEIVGHYHPRGNPAELHLEADRIDAWVGKGAQMSDAVRSLYRRQAAAGQTVADDVALEAAAEAETASDVEESQSAAPPAVDGGDQA